MDRKTDRRVARTKAALMSAFVGEVLARGYESISVEDIARRADVGRSTFYMHYPSKLALLRESVSRPSSVLAVLVGGRLDAAVVAGQLEHFHQQRTRNGTFFRDPIRRVWVERLAEMIEPRLAKLARHAGSAPKLPLPLMALQLAELQIALITNWLTHKPALKPDAVAQALTASIHGQLTALLGVDGERLFIAGEKLRFIHREQ